MFFEVERKFWVTDFSQITAQLQKLEVRLSEQTEQIDQYFTHPSRDFAKTDEALRIRQHGDRNFITYKGARIDSSTKTRQEIELALLDGAEVPAQFCEFLSMLDFKPVMKVIKRRQEGELNWQGFDVKICLDEIDQLGTFVEIETTSDAQNLDDAQALLNSLAEELSLNRNEHRSYLELLQLQLAPYR